MADLSSLLRTAPVVPRRASPRVTPIAAPRAVPRAAPRGAPRGVPAPPADDPVARWISGGSTPTTAPAPGTPTPAPTAPPVIPPRQAGGSDQGGWFNNIVGGSGRILGGVPQMVTTLTSMGVKQANALSNVAIDAATGDLGKNLRNAGGHFSIRELIRGDGSGLYGDDVYNQDMMSPQLEDYMKSTGIDPEAKTGGLLGPGGIGERYSPLATMMSQSFQNTASRIASPLDAAHQYKTAWDEGRVLDLALEDVGNVGMAAGLVGKAGGMASRIESLGAAEARALNAVPLPRSAGAMANPGQVGSVLSRSVLAPKTGALVSAERLYQIPGTGLAGKMAPGSTAEAVIAKTGATVRTVGRLGEAVDNAQLSLVPRLAIKGVRGVATKPFGEEQLGLLARAGRKADSYSAGTQGRFADLVGRFGTENRLRTHEVRALEAELGRDLVASERALLRARTIEDRGNLTQTQARAAIFNVDEVFRPLADQYRAGIAAGLPEGAFANVIERAYADVPEALRPKLDDFKMYDDWQAGRLDEATSGYMDQIDTELRRVSERDTVQKQAAGTITDDMLEPELRETQVAAVRRELEAKRDTAARQLDRETAAAAAVRRQADVREAVNAELPGPPDPKRFAQVGEAVGEAKARSAALRTEHQLAQSELRATLARYERAVNDTDAAPTIARLEKELDRKIVQLDRMQQELAIVERRVDAAIPLSQIVERVTEGADDAPGSLMDAAPRPDVDLTGLSTVSAMKATAKAIRSADEVVAWGNVESMNQGQLLLMEGQWGDWGAKGTAAERVRTTPAANRFLAGLRKYDPTPTSQGGMGDVPADIRRGSVADGNARVATSKNVVDPDVFAASMRGMFGDVDTPTALNMYFEAISNWLDAKAAAGDNVVLEIANDTGYSPEAVRAALAGSAAEFREIIRADQFAAIDDVGAAFNDMEPSIREGVLQELRDMQARGAPDAEISDFMYEALNELGPGAHLLEPIWNTVGWNQLSEWLTGKKPVPEVVYERVIGRSGLAQQRQIARMQQSIVSSKAAIRTATAEQSRLSGILDKHAAKVDRNAARAARAVDDAAGVEQRAVAAVEAFDGSADAVQAIVDSERRAARGWKRTQGKDEAGNVTHPYSPAERLIRQEGTLRERANARLAVINRTTRSLNRWNEKIADLPNELTRDFTERLVTDLNQPRIRGIAGTVRAIERKFGELKMGAAGDPPSVTGVMGDLADKYGFHDELAAALYDEIQNAEGDFMPLNARRAMQQVIEDLGVKINDVDQATIERSWQTDQLLSEINTIVVESQRAGTAANTPYRVIEHIRQQRWLNDPNTTLPDDIVSKLEQKWESYERSRRSMLTKSFDDQLAVMPATWRGIAQHSRRAIMGMLDEAETFAAAGDHTTAAILMQLAEDVPSTLQQMIDAGLDPQYIPGGMPPLRAASAGSGGIVVSSLKAEHLRTTGLRPVDLAGVTQLQINEAAKFMQNHAADYIEANMSVPVSRILGEQIAAWKQAHPFDYGAMPQDAMKAALRDAGYDVSPNHRGAPIDLTTPVIPRSVAQQLERIKAPNGPIWQFFNAGNSMFKTGVLALSPRWLTGNVVGNAWMAMFNYGMGPIELLQVVNDIAKMEGGWKALHEKGGLASFAPDSLASHGLTYNEHQLRWGDAGKTIETDPGRTAIGRGLNKVAEHSYNFNEFIDNIGRSAVYLKELQKTGGNAEAATRAGLRTMGDFTRMTPFERKFVRQAMPFYSWMRHQTVAAARLPFQSPARAAWMWHLSAMTNDPEYGDEMLQILGSRIPVGGSFMGGNYLNIGGMSPFGDPRRLPLDPTGGDFTRGLSPVADVLSKTVLGFDLGKMEKVSRPGATAPTSFWGKALPQSPLRRALSDPMAGLGEIGYQVAGELPQTKAIRDAMLGPGEFRYGSGDRGPEQYDKPGRSLDLLLRGLNLPRMDQIDIDDLLRKQAEQEARQRRQQAVSGR